MASKQVYVSPPSITHTRRGLHRSVVISLCVLVFFSGPSASCAHAASAPSGVEVICGGKGKGEGEEDEGGGGGAEEEEDEEDERTALACAADIVVVVRGVGVGLVRAIAYPTSKNPPPPLVRMKGCVRLGKT